MQSASFSTKLVLITGGSSGIGKQIAADMLRRGAQVILVAKGAEGLAQASHDLSGISSQVESFECDIGDSQKVLRLREYVLAKYGCPQIIINSAGFATYRTVEDSSLDEIEQMVNVNFLGAVRCTKAFLTCMIERRSGIIVNMASIAGRLVMTPNGTYSASKHALVAWSEVLLYELTRFGIHVHAVCPGRVEEGTAFFNHETFKTRAPRAETRLTITVNDVSRATLQAIDRNRFLTFVPWTLGIVVWLTNAFPFLVKPVYRQLMLSRIESVYTR